MYTVVALGLAVLVALAFVSGDPMLNAVALYVLVLWGE